MKETWSRIEKWLQEHAPKAYASLRPGASPETIANLAKQIGVALPAEMKEYLSIHDGQELSADCGLVDGWILMSTNQILECHKGFTERSSEGDFKGSRAKNKDGAVRATWWSDGWIPFVEGPVGDFLCFDMDPGAKGQKGQIITYWKDEGDRKVRAKTVSALLEEFANALETGGYEADDDGKVYPT